MATSNPNQSVVDDAWSSRAKRAIVAGPALLLLAALAATVAGLAYGGGATPLVVSDPGPIVMWGVPLARLAMNLSAAVTIGALVLAAWATSRHEPEFERSMTIAASAATAWVVATAAAAFLTYLQISNAPLAFDAEFGEGLAYFFTSLELGQSWVMTLGMVVVLSIVVIAVRSPGMVGFAAVYATFCLWPLGSQGHAAGAENHETVVAGITLHYIGAALWLGGLIVIALLAPRLSSVRRVALFERYSTLALIAFIIVATSGVVSSVANIGSVDQLLSPYGVLVLAKVAVFVVLGVIGWLQRRALIARMRSTAATTTSPRKPLVWLVTLELAFMGLASGAAAALGRTPSPVTEVPGSQLPAPTPAQLLTGEQLAPEFSPVRLLTEWRLDPMSTTIFLFGLFFYIAGIARLRARGEVWPVRRTVALIASVLLGLYLVNGPLIVYGKFLFSLHMAQHLLLTLLLPLLFVLSAPLTLLVRTVRARGDGSYGTREWVLAGTHARTVTFLVHPVVAATVLSVSIIGFYYTPLLRWAVSDHVGHMWMIGYFLLVGWLFAQSIARADQIGPARSVRSRALATGVVSVCFAALGIRLLTSSDLLAADWFGSLGRTWGASAIVDQQTGGAVALIMAVLLAVAFGSVTLAQKTPPSAAPPHRPLATSPTTPTESSQR